MPSAANCRMRMNSMVSVSLFKIPSYFACCTDVTKLADVSTVQRGFFLLYFFFSQSSAVL